MTKVFPRRIPTVFRRPPVPVLTATAGPPPCLLRPQSAAPLPRRLHTSRHHFPATHRRSCREMKKKKNKNEWV
ncbi:hypothetical protein AAC387_Pa12g0909 [Persea americana]